jgi:hypothetical protein
MTVCGVAVLRAEMDSVLEQIPSELNKVGTRSA